MAAPPPGYYLVWGDEFNGTSLDTTKWDYWLPGRRRDAVNVTNAVSVVGGYLTITTYTSNNTHYSGFVATDRKFRTKYGYWESSIKWGDTNGMWSAFWLQSPTMGRYLCDPQTAGSEIDIAEHRWVDGSTNPVANRVQVNIHWNGYGSSARGAGSGYVGNGLADGRIPIEANACSAAVNMLIACSDDILLMSWIIKESFHGPWRQQTRLERPRWQWNRNHWPHRNPSSFVNPQNSFARIAASSNRLPS